MYPDLSYLLHDLLGTQPDNWTSIFKTFGLFLVLAILGAAYILFIELKRKEKEGLLRPGKEKITEGLPATLSELISNAVFGFILGFKLIYIAQNFPEFQMDPAGVVLSGKGNLLAGVIGALLMTGWKYWEGQKRKKPQPIAKEITVWPSQRIGDITLIAAFSGVAGAKIFAVIEDLEAFWRDPLGMLLSGGGLAIYGGLIFGFIAVFWYLKRKNITPIHVMDAVAPALIAGYGIGRLGCHFSGDGDWGIEAAAQPDWWFLPDWLWAYNYPHNVIDEGVKMADCTWLYCYELQPPAYPTPLYEVFFTMVIFGILWALRKRLVIPGLLFCVYLFLNGVERFFIEKIRINQHYDYLPFDWTQAEAISVLLMLGGIVGGFLLWRRGRKEQAS
jgi:prolipoprotein diacylglyceryl transferase